MPVISYEEAMGMGTPQAQPQRRVLSYEEAMGAAPQTADWRDREATENLAAIEAGRTSTHSKTVPQSPVRTGAILPVSRNIETGSASPAIPEAIRGAVTLPGDVYNEGVDLEAPENVGRTLNLAGLMNPLAPGRGFTGPAPKIAPRSTEQIKAMARGVYKEAADSGLAIAASSYNRLVTGIVHKAKKEGIDKDLTPDSFAVVSRLIGEIPKQKAVDPMSRVTGVRPKPVNKTFSLEDVDTLRQVVGAARSSKSPDKANDRRIANIISDRIDDWLENLGPRDVVAGDAAAATAAITKARSLWRTMRKAETIDRIIENAMDKVGANYTSAGMQTALRQEFKALAKKPYEMRRFTKEEQKVIRSIIRGASGENLLRWIGKLAPTGNISTAISAGSGFLVGGPVGAVGVPLAGAAARGASAKLGMRKVNRLDEMVRRAPGDF